jgi:DNA polymerase-3 subunit alpha
LKYTKTGKQFAIMRVEDFTGSKEMMVWGEQFEKFGKSITKGSVVEVVAKVEQDSRNDNLQLVAQSLKLLEAPAAPAPVKGAVRSAEPFVRPLVLRLQSGRDSVDDLHSIRGILAAHPGAVPVHLNVRSAGGKRVHLVTSVRISSESAIMAELKPWLD